MLDIDVTVFGNISPGSSDLDGAETSLKSAPTTNMSLVSTTRTHKNVFTCLRCGWNELQLLTYPSVAR